MRFFAVAIAIAGLSFPSSAFADVCTCDDPEAGYYGMGMDVAPRDGLLETPDLEAPEPRVADAAPLPVDTHAARTPRRPARALWCTGGDPSRCRSDKGSESPTSTRPGVPSFIAIVPAAPAAPRVFGVSARITARHGLGAGRDPSSSLERPPRVA